MTVRDFFDRLEAHADSGQPMDLWQLRKDIGAEHERATTTADRVDLLRFYKNIMDGAERNTSAENLAEFRENWSQYYNLLLVKEAVIGDDSGNINPQRLAAITRREVAAGRMAADNDFHKLAVAAANVHRPLPVYTGPTLLGWLKNLFRR